MVKPEWGTKRICMNCGARFYDLNKNPITCPACETEFAEEDFSRNRRGRSAPAEPAAKAKPAVKEKPKVEAEAEAVEDEEELADVEVDVEVDVEDDADEEEDNVIEDASELGEDDDDMAEIVDGVDEEKET